MNIIRSYECKRNNKDYINFRFFSEDGNSWNIDIKDKGFDLRNKSIKHLAMLDAFDDLTQKGYILINCIKST